MLARLVRRLTRWCARGAAAELVFAVARLRGGFYTLLGMLLLVLLIASVGIDAPQGFGAP